MTANDSKSTPKKAEDATRHPLALLADRPQRRELDFSNPKFGECQECGQRAYLAESVCGSCHDAAHMAEWQAYAEQLESALRAQAEAEAAVRSENAVLRDFVEAFANEDGCGCGYSRELLDTYGAAYELMWPKTALAQAGAGSDGGDPQ